RWKYSAELHRGRQLAHSRGAGDSQHLPKPAELGFEFSRYWRYRRLLAQSHGGAYRLGPRDHSRGADCRRGLQTETESATWLAAKHYLYFAAQQFTGTAQICSAGAQTR